MPEEDLIEGYWFYEVIPLDLVQRMVERDTAIATAVSYLGTDAHGLWVESAIRITAQRDDVMLAELRHVLGRELDDLETRLAREQNRNKWLIQFVFMETEPGDTPQGPCVLVFDDGDISRYRPM